MTVSGRAIRTLDVEQFLIWVYRDQKADVVIGRGAGLHALERRAAGQVVTASTPTAQVLRTLELGETISGSGSASVSGVLHPDAEAAHRMLELQPRTGGVLVLMHAKTGTRPEWFPHPRHRFEPRWIGEARYAASGLPHKSYVQMDAKAKYYVGDIDWGPSCQVNDVDAPVVVEAARLAYELWRETLVVLAEYCARWSWHSHRVTPAVIPARPWQEGGTAGVRLAS